jgi:hypothetical protein
MNTLPSVLPGALRVCDDGGGQQEVSVLIDGIVVVSATRGLLDF